MCKRTASLFLTFVILTSFFIILQATVAETPEVLVQGAPIHGTNGIMFDSNDRLHIASVVGREIVVMDPETGEILDRLGTDLGIEGPDDLTFGPDGSLYWTSILTGEVGRLSPDGVKTGQMVMPGVNPITFSDDDRLFVALDFLGDGLYELDPDLVEPPRLIIETLGFLNAFDFGPDGFLYGPIWTMGQVVRIDVDTAEVTPVVDDIGIPGAVKFDSQGRLHILDHLRGEVLRVDTETGSKEVIAQLPPGGDNLAFDSQDRLFVSHAGDGSIFEVLPDGTTRTVSPGGMIVSGGVAVLTRPDDGESVFVADLFTLREFDGLTGQERSMEHSLLTVPGSITSPFTVSSDGGNLVLSSWFANEVQAWNPETHEPLGAYADFAVPLNAIRFQGDLVVAELGQEAGAARVVRASAADPAKRVTLIDSTGGLLVPAGLAANNDDLWVGDWATGMVLQLIADGELLAEPVPVAMNLAFPEGITVAPDGNLLVVETGAGRLSRINLANGEVSTVAEGLAVGFPGISGYPPTWVFSGVAVGPSGTIYITSDINNQLLAIPPPSETEVNKELVRRYIEEVWNQQNLELAAEIVSPDIVGYVPEGDLSDPEVAGQHIPGTLAAFPDFHITIEEMMAEGDKVGMRYATLGTHGGPLMGTIPPTGKQVTSTGIAIFQIADGKIVGAWSMADMLGMMQQIGVIPSDREGYTWVEPLEVTGDPGEPEANKTIIQRIYNEIWNAGNVDLADEIIAPEFVGDYVPDPPTLGPEGFKQLVAITLSAFPDMHWTIGDQLAEGNKVVTRWTFRGTHTGDYLDIPPTGKVITVTGMSLDCILDGKLVQAWSSRDALGALQKLGVIPSTEPKD